MLLNLGGPENLQAVKFFLFNLFNDRAILNFPQPFRYILAKFISKYRSTEAKNIYRSIGGKSPLLENTKLQANALEKLLPANYKVFTSMRYCCPRAKEVVQEIKNWQANRIILFPLYPQYSTTTTESSFKEFQYWQKKYFSDVNLDMINSYQQDDAFIMPIVDTLSKQLGKLNDKDNYRVLFSAHGIPRYLIKKGDPYKFHIEQSVEAVVSKMPQYFEKNNIDYQLCYQSKVGPLEWLSPYTVDEVHRAAKDKVGLIIVPIAFVSEHLETLYELDIEYKNLADSLGILYYKRIPTVSCHPLFIKGISKIICSQ